MKILLLVVSLIVCVYIDSVNCCKCLDPIDPKVLACKRNVVAVVKITHKVWEDCSEKDGPNRRVAYYVGQICSCHDILKSNAAFRKLLKLNNNKIAINTMSGTSCQVKLDLCENYIIIADVNSNVDKITVNGCSYFRKLNELSDDEYEGFFNDKYLNNCCVTPKKTKVTKL